MAQTEPRLTVVTPVHYVGLGHSLGTYTSTCRAALVTNLKDENTVSLAVFGESGVFFYKDVTYDEGKASGTWHWPEPVDVPTSSVNPAGYPSVPVVFKDETGTAHA